MHRLKHFAFNAKSYTHAMHLNNIYKEYTELHTEKENENEN